MVKNRSMWSAALALACAGFGACAEPVDDEILSEDEISSQEQGLEEEESDARWNSDWDNDGEGDFDERERGRRCRNRDRRGDNWRRRHCKDSGVRDSGVRDSGVRDSGVRDSGVRDSGPADSGRPDSGTPDSGRPDSGTPDSGRPDSGTNDSGTPDSGRPDTGTPDSGTIDSGTPDSGTPDTGTPDTGLADTGTPDSGTPGVPLPAECLSCANTNCNPNPFSGQNLVTDCADSLCRAIIQCAVDTDCAINDESSIDPGSISRCYCGPVTPDVCDQGSYVPNGDCQDLFEDGVGSTVKSEVILRLTDATYSGADAFLLLQCAAEFCPSECAALIE